MVTHSFRRSLIFSAGFALLVLPVLAMLWITEERRRPPPGGETQAPAEA